MADKDEAQKIVDELKKDYAKKYTKKLGIVQVYSDNYKEIAAVDSKKAKSAVSKILKNTKKADDIKLAKARAASQAKAAEASSKVSKITKQSNVKGINFILRGYV